MSNNPIQIVLNTKDFIHSWERQGGGLNKDFYAGKDSEFVSHRDKVYDELSAIKDLQIGNEFSEVSFAKLKLKQSGLAKSHRPTYAIFNKSIAPVVGAGDLGELYVELEPSNIEKIQLKISQVETQTRYKEIKVNNKLKTVPNPSNLRSELGSIDELSPYTSSDKRKFSITEGLKWISNPQTGGSYLVELFQVPPPRQDWDSLSTPKLKLFKSFQDGLANFGNGLTVARLIDSDKNSALISVRIEESEHKPSIQLSPVPSSKKRPGEFPSISLDKNKHATLLKFLDAHPLVKKITLPPIISKSQATSAKSSYGSYTLPKLNSKKIYPKVAIVDGGISSVCGDWLEDKHGYISDKDKDEDHGTFIAGLLISSSKLNTSDVCKELEGCKIIDIDILPKAGSFANYYSNPLDFFKELEVAVKDLKARTGVRIFNFSLNIEEHVSTDGYSAPAQLLDKIALENDVIFVISAGNTKEADLRKEWPKNSRDALRILASSRNDTIKKPAESCRNLSVSALNPPNLKDIIAFAPSNYTCRGPGTRVGLKPDLAHVGGAGTKLADKGHGLYSINPSGSIVDGCGTSYSAPHVSKALACLDDSIEGDVSRETLMALTIHHASHPEVLLEDDLKEIAKHLVGFGIPASSQNILNGSENSITLVFANRIYPGLKMSFDFTWPPSLVRAGKCCGYAKLTVVSTPPFDYRFGSEFVRINIEGHLRQQQNDGKYKGRLDPIYLPQKGEGHTYEKDQIAHAFKWSPIKVFEKTFPHGVGPTTNWKLEVEYLARDGEDVPVTGVPFTALLTISDPKGEEQVFTDMKQSLQALGVQIMDIQTAARVIPRV